MKDLAKLIVFVLLISIGLIFVFKKDNGISDEDATQPALTALEPDMEDDDVFGEDADSSYTDVNDDFASDNSDLTDGDNDLNDSSDTVADDIRRRQEEEQRIRLEQEKRLQAKRELRRQQELEEQLRIEREKEEERRLKIEREKRISSGRIEDGEETTKPSFTLYTVKEGDTLGKISKKHFGSSKYWEQIMDFNKDVLKSPESLTINSRIRIPAIKSASKTVQPEARIEKSTSTPANTKSRIHKIASGDNFYRLAKKYYGKSSLFNKIVEANPKVDPSNLQIGQEIIIP